MKKFTEFVGIVKRLRQECPWDREQTLESLKPYLVEEVYEAIQAIDDQDYRKLADEVGDMLLHVVMLSVFAQEDKHFDINDVIENISAKMIRRHPHVFAKGDAKTKEQVWEKWEKIKKTEAQRSKDKDQSMLKSIPNSMPALYRADRIQKRASRVGFDWDQVAGAWEKVHEELEEVHALLKSKDQKLKSKIPNPKLSEEIGDLLFAITNVARKLDINAEEALQQANNKFIRRFAAIEKELAKKSLSIEQMDELWEKAKAKEQAEDKGR